VSSLTSFNWKVVLFLATKPLTCAHIYSIGLSSQCWTRILITSCPCKLAILSVLWNYWGLFMPTRRRVGGGGILIYPLSVRSSVRIQIHGLSGYLLLQFWSYSFNIL
jgi:hypothetical protein